MIKNKNTVLCLALALALYGCSDSDSGSETAADQASITDNNNAQTNEQANMDSASNADVVNDTDAASDAGAYGEIVGVWERCVSDVNAFVWEFESNNNFRAYSVPDCADTYGIAESTQGGTYTVLGTSISEEGLEVYDMQFKITDVFGGNPADDAPDFYVMMHIDQDTMYFGFIGGSTAEASRTLFLDTPHLRQ